MCDSFNSLRLRFSARGKASPRLFTCASNQVSPHQVFPSGHPWGLSGTAVSAGWAHFPRASVYKAAILNWQYCLIKTHWGWVMHICARKLTITGPGNGLSPGRRQTIIWTHAGILLTGPTNFSEISIEIHTFSFNKNVFENVVCNITSISPRHQCVKYRAPTHCTFLYEVTI